MTEPPVAVGPWTILNKLGSGGNATVWRATRDNSQTEVALKVINSTKVRREPYQRFVREVEFLRLIGEEPGVLPLLDAELPDRPSSTNRAWLAMPIATPISEALAERPLDVVVTALEEIATTLARLAGEHELAHRDLKPGNLYHLKNRFLVGDFGLIALPDVEELTRSGRPLGPAHYTAYEMILDPVSADPFAADIYSLGKTLWVLATGLGFPPEGHQPATTRRFSIADTNPHPHADALDRLVDRATRLHAEERPSMVEFASDLRAWRDLGLHRATIDVSDLRARFRAKAERQLAAEDLLEQRKELALAAVRLLQELVRPLNEALRQLNPRAVLDATGDKLIHDMLRTYRTSGSPDIVWGYDRMSEIAHGSESWRYRLIFSRALELTEDGTLIFRTLVDVAHASFGGSDYSWQSGATTAPVGSVEADRMLESGIADLGVKLREGLAAYVEHLPEPTG